MNCTCGKDLGVGHDGERRVCHCGKKWVCVVEGGLGVYFVPDVKPDVSMTTHFVVPGPGGMISSTTV